MVTGYIRQALTGFLCFLNNPFFLIRTPITATLYRRHHVDFCFVSLVIAIVLLLCLIYYHRLVSGFIGATPGLYDPVGDTQWHCHDGAANKYLKKVYLPRHNQQFCVKAKIEKSAYIPWIGGDLNEILCH